MKKKLTLFLMFSLITAISFNASAKKWRVNNTPGINANFSTFVAAYNGSAAGDSIYLEGTGIPYVAPDTIKKKLIIIGPGYFLALNDSTQANLAPASIYNLVLGKGSDGSVVTGLTITNSLFITDASNITIQRNYINSYLYLYNYWRNITNIIIKQNFIATNITQPSNTKSATNVFLLNNIINVIDLENSTSTIICMNNTIVQTYYINNAEFYNNINQYLYSQYNAGVNNHFYNNVYACAGTNADGNKFSINMTDVFVGATGNSTDGQYKLKPASPAKGAGYGGVDCGAFANTQPYVLSGIPALPHIFDAKVENSGSSGTGLPVHIKAKSLN